MLNIALPTGRLGKDSYQLLEKAGFTLGDYDSIGRQLVVENPHKDVRYFWVKPADVAIYVERGVADVGVVGKDTLMEQDSEVYELLDLKLGVCRMAVACKESFQDNPSKTLRVATKYERVAWKYYQQQGRPIDIIKLNGSVEIAPLLGLSDVIVDIVETGRTLRENKLEERELIAPISARFIANKVSFQFKNDSIKNLQEAFVQQLELVE